MKTETPEYAAERVKLQTDPAYFVRFEHVKVYGDGTSYPFSVDFATRDVANPTKSKALWMLRPAGAAQAIEHENGRSSIGTWTLRFLDRQQQFFRYLAAPPLTLKTAMTAGAPGVGGYVEANEATDGLATQGTLLFATGERVRYDLNDTALKRFRVSGRGADGTAAAAHNAGEGLTNGEQIRPGIRAQLYAGYAPLDEAKYMPLVKMEVVERGLLPDGVTFQVTIADIQRSLRRTIFLGATADTPVVLTGNPLTLYLQAALSTGAGTNGPYDVLSAANGAATPQALVDVAGIESLRDSEFPAEVYNFSITGELEAKEFFEQEILKTLNCYPAVTQDGRLTVRRAPHSTYRDTVVADSPLTYWRLGESAGATAYDAIKQQLNGTYAGGVTLGAASLPLGDSNAGATFDAVDDAMTTAAAPAVTGAIAFEFWIKKAAAPAAERAVIERATAAGDFTKHQGVRIDAAGKVKFILKNGTPAENIALLSSISVCDGVAHHVLVQHDGGNVQKIYIDGVERASGAVTHNTANTLATAWFVNKSYDGAAVYLGATLDELAIYGATLSTTRIGAHYTAGAGGIVLDQNSIISWGWQPGDRSIINIVETEYDWDLPATRGIFVTRQQYRADLPAGTSSIDKYGRRPAFTITSRGIRTANGGQAILDERAKQIIRCYSEPPFLLPLDVFYTRHVLEPGDVVTVSHPNIPHERTGLRGLTNEPFLVLNSQIFCGAEGRLRLLLLWIPGLPSSASAPTSGGAVNQPIAIRDDSSPNTPTGFALSTGVTIDADGTQQVFFDASWGANPEADLLEYEVQFRRQGDTKWSTRSVGKGTTSLREFAVGNTTYEARMRAIDTSGNASAFTTTQTVLTTKDAVAPATPAGVSGVGGIESALITWTAQAEADFAAMEIWRANSNDRTLAVKVGEAIGVGFLDTKLLALTTYYYWLRARDTSGNLSGYHAGITAGLAVTTAGRVGYKATLNARVWTGTFPNSQLLASFVYDTQDSELDWLVKVGADLHWGESSPNASIATALGLKFTGQTQVASAWDGTNHHVAIVTTAGVVRYAKLDRDGTVLIAVADLFTPSGTNKYTHVALDAKGSSLHWALYLDEYTGGSFTQSKVQYARTDLSGVVQQAVTDVTGTTKNLPGDEIRIGADSDGNAHIFFRRLNIQCYDPTVYDPTVYQCEGLEAMRYVKVNGAGVVQIAVSQPLLPPPGSSDLAPAGVLVDNADVVHVIGYAYTGVGIMFAYGRMSKTAVVQVATTLFYATPTDVIFAYAAMDRGMNQIYVAWATSTGISQIRLDPVDPTAETTDTTLVKAGL